MKPVSCKEDNSQRQQGKKGRDQRWEQSRRQRAFTPNFLLSRQSSPLIRESQKTWKEPSPPLQAIAVKGPLLPGPSIGHIISVLVPDSSGNINTKKHLVFLSHGMVTKCYTIFLETKTFSPSPNLQPSEMETKKRTEILLQLLSQGKKTNRCLFLSLISHAYFKLFLQSGGPHPRCEVSSIFHFQVLACSILRPVLCPPESLVAHHSLSFRP